MATAIQPKLRVFLDPFGPSHNDNSGAQERHLKLNLALQQFVQEPLQGPLLHLTDCEPRSVLREVAAAVQSML